MARLIRLSLVAGLLSATAASLPPRDECAAEPGFAEFRSHFKNIVQRRDAEALVALTSPTIRTSFGDNGGLDAFRTHWNIAKGAESPVWNELQRLVELGCAKGSGWLAMPHLYQRLPETSDPFETVVATGKAIPLRALAKDDADVLETLDWAILTALESDAPEPWMNVRTESGVSGYVRRDEVRSPLDYRAVFELKDGRWMMTALLAGD